MKKIVLSMLFVMMAFSINANTIMFSTQFAIDDDLLVDDCFQRAWNYGTSMGNGDSYWTWYYTNKYYNQNCDVEQDQ